LFPHTKAAISKPMEWNAMFLGRNWIQSLITRHWKSLLQETQQLSY